MSANKFKIIASTIEQRISSGHYESSEALPTHRELAKELGTTPTTAAKAYQLLITQGLVESKVGSGTFIKKATNLDQVIQATESISEYNFSILQPKLSANRNEVQSAIQQASITTSNELLGYVEQSGYSIHKEMGLKWCQTFGLNTQDRQEIILTNGAQNALATLIQLYSQPGDIIAVEQYTYPGILSLIHQLERSAMPVEMDQDGLNPHNLTQVIRLHRPALVIAIPSHQNPSGITMTRARRQHIAQVIKQHNTWLIEDDIYGFLNGDRLGAISNYAPDRCFYISALSKAISPALRCGYIRAPLPETQRINSFIRATIWLASPLTFEAASHLIRTGQAFELAKKQRQIALDRQSVAQRILGQNSRCEGYHLWHRVPQHWQPDSLAMEAKNQEIIISSGNYFCTTRDSQHIRLSLMAIEDDDKFEEGLCKLNALLHSQPQEHMTN